MAATILASTSRTTLMSLVRRVLAERGFVEAEHGRDDAISIMMWALKERAGCSVIAGRSAWFISELVRTLADEAIEAIAASVEIEVLRRQRDVRIAETFRISGGEVDSSDEQETANEIFHDWTDGEDFDPPDIEGALADALLDIDEIGVRTEREHIAFARDPELAAAAEARARARAEAAAEAEARAKEARATPAPWKRLRHPDGRKWAVRLHGGGDGFDLEITDEEGEVFTRSRKHDNARGEVAMLIVAQLRDGFIDE